MGDNKIGGYVRKGASKVKKWWSNKSTAQKALTALRIANGLRMIVNAEKKFYDRSNNVELTNVGQVDLLTAIAQGSGESQRNGNSVLLKSVLVRGRITTDAPNATIRVMLIHDKSPDPGTVTLADILTGASDGYAPFNPMNDDNRRRFRVLGSKLMSINSNNTNMPFKFYVKLNHHARWNSSTSTDINVGHVYLVFANILSGVTYDTYAISTSRITYYDN